MTALKLNSTSWCTLIILLLSTGSPPTPFCIWSTVTPLVIKLLRTPSSEPWPDVHPLFSSTPRHTAQLPIVYDICLSKRFLSQRTTTIMNQVKKKMKRPSTLSPLPPTVQETPQQRQHPFLTNLSCCEKTPELLTQQTRYWSLLSHSSPPNLRVCSLLNSTKTSPPPSPHYS